MSDEADSRRNSAISEFVKMVAKQGHAGEVIDVPVIAVHDNLEQEIIRVTCDRLKLRLGEHLDKIQLRSRWQAPAGVAIATLTSLLTSDYKDFLLLNAATWKAIFVLLMIVSTIMFIHSLIVMPRSESIEDVVDSLRHGDGKATRPTE